MNWIDRCELLLNEDLNTKEMMAVTGKNNTEIRKLRLEIVAEQIEKGEPLCDTRRIPTELFLEKIGKTYQYYEIRAKRQARLNELKSKKL